MLPRSKSPMDRHGRACKQPGFLSTENSTRAYGTLLRYVALYNHQLPQSALGSKTPMQAMKDWYQEHPHLFRKRPYDRPGCDT